MTKSSKDVNKDNVLDNVLNDDNEVEIINDDVHLDNKAVTATAVVKVTQSDDDDDNTKIFPERVANVLGDEALDDEAKQDAKKDTKQDEAKQETAKQKADELKDTAKQTANDVKQNVKDKAETVKDNAKETMDDIKQASDKAADTAKQKADELKDTASEKAQEAKDKAREVKEVASDKADELKDRANDKLDDAKQLVNDKAQELSDKADELKDTASEKAQDVKAAANDKIDELSDKADELKDSAGEKLDELKQTASDKFDEVKQTATDKADELKQTASDTIDTAKEKVEETKEGFSAKASEVKELAQEKFGQVKAYAEGLVGSIKDKVQDTKETAGDTIDTAKQKVEETKEQAESFIQDKKETLLSESESLQAKLQASKEELLGKKEELLGKFDDAYADAKEYEQTHGSGIAAKLGAVGAYFASIYNSKNSYQAVDLEQENFDEDAFRRQSSQLGKEILGGKAVIASNIANKFISDDKMNAVSEKIYGKLASWASDWASSDLEKDERFDRIHMLSDNEKDVFADDISNQNRALATLGGITGLMGLKGVVADTAWLLMVSLKSVYQLSIVYDKPLTGKEGAKLAYGILSQCDLDKLQEKQVIMTALALGNTVLKNAQGTSVVDELKRLGSKYQNRSYAKQFDTLAEYVNFDRFNPAWLHYVLPVGSVAVSVHYNNELIDEVLGVAKATFSGQKVSGLLEDKSSVASFDHKKTTEDANANDTTNAKDTANSGDKSIDSNDASDDNKTQNQVKNQVKNNTKPNEM